jgi:hypothetical protein
LGAAIGTTGLIFGMTCRGWTGAGASFFCAGCTFLYFAVKRSTRPAGSTIFCLPVKNGWQFEQISTVMPGRVERVSMTFPQAHVIATGAYLG